MNAYRNLKVDDYERVLEIENPEVGLSAWIALHSTRLGPALGGCRMWNYASREAAIEDVLRLSRAMTYKNALAGLDFGGGKAAIWGDAQKKTEPLLEAMGEAVEFLHGAYVTAEDVGMNFEDMKVFRRKTRHIPSINAGDPAPATARGVFNGMHAVCRQLGIRDLSGLSVAVQGTGSVGHVLIGLLVKAGCRVIASDVNGERLNRAVKDYGVDTIGVDNIYDTACDIFSPCALGGIINSATIERLSRARIKAIAGSANNQLAEDGLADVLVQRGILYAPDFAINAGGVILLAGETPAGFDQALVDSRLEGIGPTLDRIFQAAERENKSTVRIANALAEARFKR
ncbi:MAG TPA: Glu/Leu/Phe/Val dehydrogenase dimerization domain-containing protein [Gammaproteobacteria bacterium]|nr:Glu/Leu/Phe/Val dehydrogenase dimerization domain-containing protein [Gammaproteobacteria bacterium]